MNIRSGKGRIVIHRCTAVVVVASFGVSLAIGQVPDVMKRLRDERAATIVTVRSVFKVQMSFMGSSRDEESTTEAPGVVVSPQGLIACSNTQLGGYAGMMSRMSEMEYTITPIETKVLFAGDTREYEATLITRDKERDLAWIRIKDPGEKTFPFVDLSLAGTAGIGARVYLVSRLPRQYDRAPVVRSTVISGSTEQPRSLLVTEDSLQDVLGLPAYTEEMKVLGLVVLQGPNPDDVQDERDDDMGMMGGWGSYLAAVLPAEEVSRALALALDTVQDATP